MCTYKTQFSKTVIGLKQVLVSKQYSSLQQDDNIIQNRKLKTFRNAEKSTQINNREYNQK